MTTRHREAGTSTLGSSEAGTPDRDRRPPGRTVAVGGFYLMMSGINTGLAIGDPQVYDTFAKGGLFAFVRTGWSDVVMADPRLWILLLAAGEATMGVLLLVGGRAARMGWVAVLAFHALLLLFGWGVWAYAVPAIALLARLLRHDWHRL